MLKSGHRIHPVTGKESQKLFTEFPGNPLGNIRLEPDGWFLGTPFIEFGDKYYDFTFKPSDVVVMTYPKCGTTWTQEIVWTLAHNTKLDNPKAKESINVRCPFLEFDFIAKSFPELEDKEHSELYKMFTTRFPGRNPDDGIFLQLAEMAKDPRIIKTHLSFSLLSPSLLDTCKVIYVVRNPKDVVLSYLHHSRLIKSFNFTGSLDDFIDHFINDTLLYSPYWIHVKEAWGRRNHPNLYICYYEDMKANPKTEIEGLKRFLNLDCTEEQINNIVDYTSFSSMKKRDNFFSASEMEIFMNKTTYNSDGGIFRKGEAGDWKEKLSPSQVKTIDDWTKKQLETFDGNFKYKTEVEESLKYVHYYESKL